MGKFLQENGMLGLEHAHHTATGYECVANHPGNKKGELERVMFFAKHTVGADGHPYTEVGLSGLYDFEREESTNKIKDALKENGMREVDCISESKADENVFSEHVCTDFDSVSVRVCAGTDGISIIVGVVGKIILESSRQFMQEQEQVPDVLFESILDSMGDEMDRGPGGHDMAVKKAKMLANQFLYGVSDASLTRVVGNA